MTTDRISRGLFYTGYMWALLLLTIPPLSLALYALPRGRRPDALIKRWARLLIQLSGCRLRVRGLEHLQQDGPMVLVANHASYVDSIVLMAALPIEFRFVVNEQAVTWPVVGLAIRKVGHLVVDRTRLAGRHGCVLEMRDALRRGTSLVVFPEGTIHQGVELLPFQSGAFRIAVEVGRPVVPVSLRGTPHVLRDGRGVFRRGQLDVTIHAPIQPVGKSRQEIFRLRDRARQEIISLCQEPFCC